MNPYESGAVIDMNMGRNRATPAPVGADALREALWICVEHNALHFGETHNTVVQGRAALASAAQPPAEPAATNDCTCSHPNADMLRAIADGNPVSTASYGKHAMRPNAELCGGPSGPSERAPG